MPHYPDEPAALTEFIRAPPVQFFIVEDPDQDYVLRITVEVQ